MNRIYLNVMGCDDHTVIALDDPSPAERAFLANIVGAVNEAAQDGCQPSLEISELDPDANEDYGVYDDEPERYPDRPLLVIP